MARFSQNIKTQIKHAFGNLNVDAALIGSGSDRDLDIFIVNNSNTYSNYLSTKPFLDMLPNLKKNLNCEIIVKYDHYHRVKKGKKKLVHLLFYPSCKHLRIWELPAFISGIHDRGEFFIGNNKSLISSYKKYRSRKLDLDFDILTYHIYRLVDVAITNLVYLTSSSSIFAMEEYIENLIYIYRYTLREFLISELKESSRINFWEWDELVNFTRKKPILEPLYHLFSLKNAKSARLLNEDIRLLFIEYLKFCDTGLSGIRDLKINDILKRK
jgi:hypothetical protein